MVFYIATVKQLDTLMFECNIDVNCSPFVCTWGHYFMQKDRFEGESYLNGEFQNTDQRFLKGCIHYVTYIVLFKEAK